MVTSLIMGNTVPSPSWSVLSAPFEETTNCFSGQILTGKRGCFLRIGLDFIIPTEALLECHSSRSADGPLVHLRLRENLFSLFFCLILLLKHKFGHLAGFAHTAGASSFSCTLWHLEGWHFHSFNEENKQQETQGRQQWEERGIPARHCRNVELSLWVYVCWLHTCQSTGRAHKSTASQVLWTSS